MTIDSLTQNSTSRAIPAGHTVIENEDGSWYTVSDSQLAAREFTRTQIEESYLRSKALTLGYIAETEKAILEETEVDKLSGLHEQLMFYQNSLTNIEKLYTDSL